MHIWRRKLVLFISYKIKYLQNEARKQKSVKEVTLQFSMIFQIRLKNNTVNFRVICPLNINLVPRFSIFAPTSLELRPWYRLVTWPVIFWRICSIVFRERIQTFQLSRFYRESPENSYNLLVSRFLSNSPDFSEYSGNIVKIINILFLAT
jgi:hypothetical protein